MFCGGVFSLGIAGKLGFYYWFHRFFLVRYQTKSMAKMKRSPDRKEGREIELTCCGM
jgi:hypothetical protein